LIYIDDFDSLTTECAEGERMAKFTFTRRDTGQFVSFEAQGRKYAAAKAVVEFGLRADEAHLVQEIAGARTGKKRNGNRAWKPGRHGLRFKVSFTDVEYRWGSGW
jgi:hypothetical protein